ncbi:MAG: membrane dipeptidase [Ardenticatenaceae bacterium]|nr:membrane dipeptidase [Ardenticatenaceae bacterium]
MIIDAHLDLAHSALENGRDLFASLADLREHETHQPLKDGVATVTFPELRQGNVGLVFATIFIRPAQRKKDPPAKTMFYRTADEAYAKAGQQLDYYRRLTDETPSIRLVGDIASLDEVKNGQEQEKPLLGLVPSMEGADPIRHPQELEEWWERGLRVIGPAWDDTRYAAGAWRGTRHGFTKEGFELLEVMTDLGFILDLTHLGETAVQEALERYDGPIVATHSNCRRLVPQWGQRHLTDDHIRLLGERDGVVGIVLANPFLRKNHVQGERKELVTLDHVVAHIDHVCQLLGSADHVGIGSDFDGGFGQQDIPVELDSIADLAKIGEKLKEKGYDPADINLIMGGNWERVLRDSWGE